MSHKPRIAVAALVAAGALAVPSLSGADSTKTCTTSDSPHNNWTSTNTQTSSCNSASDNKSSPVSATNPGGNQPAGQQP